MKQDILELLAEASEQIKKEGHDVYSKSEVLILISNLRNQIGDLPDQPIMNKEIAKQIRRTIDLFDFEFNFDLNHDAKIEATVENTDDLAEEILDLIGEYDDDLDPAGGHGLHSHE